MTAFGSLSFLVTLTDVSDARVTILDFRLHLKAIAILNTKTATARTDTVIIIQGISCCGGVGVLVGIIAFVVVVVVCCAEVV